MVQAQQNAWVSASLSDATAWRGQGGRLEANAARDELSLSYQGPQIVVGTAVYTPDGTGLGVCSTSDNTMSGIGTDTGVTPSSDTLYFAYACNQGDFAGRIALSTIGPTMSEYGWCLNPAASLNQIVFVGWVLTDSSGGFRDETNFRGVCSYFFRRPKSLLVRAPAYNNNNATMTFVFNSATWAILAANFTATYVDNGVDSAAFAAQIVTDANTTAELQFGLVDSVIAASSPSAASCVRNGAVAPVTCNVALSCAPEGGAGAMGPGQPGARSVSVFGMSGGVNATLRADVARNGATFDPCATLLSGWMMG